MTYGVANEIDDLSLRETKRRAKNQPGVGEARRDRILTFLPVTSAILDQTARRAARSLSHPATHPWPKLPRLTDRPPSLKQDEQAHAETQFGIGGAKLFSQLFECRVVNRRAERGGEGGKGDHDEDDGLTH